MQVYYEHYFKQLASDHLGHSDEDTSFYVVDDVYNPKAFDDAIKSLGKTPALLLERYSGDLDENSSKNHFKHLNGRFSYILQVELGNKESIIAAHARAEQLCEYTIAKMANDLGQGVDIVLPDNTRRKVYFSIERVPIDFIGPMLGKYYGATAGFVWKCPFKTVYPEGTWV